MAGRIFLIGLLMTILMLVIYGMHEVIWARTVSKQFNKPVHKDWSYIGGRRVMTDEYGWIGGNALAQPRERNMGEMYGEGWQPFPGWTRVGIADLAEDWRRERESPKKHRVYSDGLFRVDDHWPTCLHENRNGGAIGVWSDEYLKCPRPVYVDEPLEGRRKRA